MQTNGLRKLLSSLYYDLPRLIPGGTAMPCRNWVIEVTHRDTIRAAMPCSTEELDTLEQDSLGPELSITDWLHIIRSLPPRSNLTITGGAPLTKDGIQELLSVASFRHETRLMTTGTGLEDAASMLVDSGLASVGVRLDGPAPLHDRINNHIGAFDALHRGLSALLALRREFNASRPRLSVTTILRPENAGSLSDTIHLAADLGADAFAIQILDPSPHRSGLSLTDTPSLSENHLSLVPLIERQSILSALSEAQEAATFRNLPLTFSPAMTAQEIADYYEGRFDLSAWRCQMPWSTTRITPYGDVYPCLNMHIGSCRNTSPGKAWRNGRYASFRRIIQQNTLPPACAGCCKMIRR